MHYPIKKSGYYCVSTFYGSNSSTSDSSGTGSGSQKYTGAVRFQNAFGELPASDAARLPFFSGATIVYTLVLAAWLVAYTQYRRDVLPLQTALTGLCAFLVLEMIIIWGYYDFVNRWGSTTFGAKFYVVILALITAVRNTGSFAVVLVVCMGYGVVREQLEPEEWKRCAVVGVAHLVSAVVYMVSTAVAGHDTASAWLLIAMLPLLLTTAVFFVLVLSALSQTITDLETRQQSVKARMYITLWWLLFSSVLVVFAMFSLNLGLYVSAPSTADYVTRYWRVRWFLLDGWGYILYGVDFCVIAFLWRPTENNRRFAMSQQVPQFDDEFGVDSEDDDEDEEDIELREIERPLNG